jgi:hypothetical protein
MLATRRSLRVQAHLPGTRTSAGHLVVVATSPLNPYATKTARRTPSCRRTGTNSCPARSPPRSGWRRADDDHREGPTREKPTHGRRLGPPNHAPATPHIVTYQHHFVGLLQSPAPPPSRHGRRDVMTATHRSRTTVNTSGVFVCEEDGELHLQSAVRPRVSRPGPVLRLARIDRLGDRGRRRRQGNAARTCTGSCGLPGDLDCQLHPTQGVP